MCRGGHTSGKEARARRTVALSVIVAAIALPCVAAIAPQRGAEGRSLLLRGSGIAPNGLGSRAPRGAGSELAAYCLESLNRPVEGG